MKKIFKACCKTSLFSGLYLIINMLAIIGTTVYLSFYNDDFYRIMYSIFMENGDYNQLYDLIAYLVAPTTIITGVCIVLIYIGKSLIQRKCTIKKISLEMVVLMMSIGYVANIIVSGIVDMLPKNLITNGYSDSINLALSTDNFWQLLLATGIAAPILEEIIFRDWIYNSWSKINVLVAMIISSFMFGVAHLNLIQSTYAFILGMLFVYINGKFNSILPGIIMHLTVNSSSVILETYKVCANLWFIPFIAASCFILYEIYKYKKIEVKRAFQVVCSLIM